MANKPNANDFQETFHSLACTIETLLNFTMRYRHNHRRRIYTEDKAKVVAAVGGTEFIQFLAALYYFAPG